MQPVSEAVHDISALTPDLLSLAEFVATYYQQPLGLVIAQMVPPLAAPRGAAGPRSSAAPQNRTPGSPMPPYCNGIGARPDRTKRPLMGVAAAELSDYVVLTSDNPRSEDPLGIMNDVMVGLGRFDTPHISEPNRATAISKALEMAQPGDAVLLAGKGHEAYQILKDRTIDFDDRAAARAALQSMGYAKPS